MGKRQRKRVNLRLFWYITNAQPSLMKTLLSAVLISISTFAFGQRNTQLHSFAEAKGKMRLTPSSTKPLEQPSVQTKALNILWSEDFSGGTGALQTANGQWVSGGTNGSYWEIGDNPHPLSGDGWTEQMDAEYLKWDSYTPNSNEPGGFSTTMLDGEIVSPSISYTGNTNSIGIQFKTEALYCCNYELKPFGVAASMDDGATWSATLPIDMKIGKNDATEDIAHPLEIFVNLSSIVPAGSQSTFKLKFIWDGSVADTNGQYNTHYFWLIDDLAIYEIPDNDLAATSSYFGTNGLSYYQIPNMQIAPIEFSTNALNNGLATQTDAQLKVDIDAGATFSGYSTTGINMTPGASDSLFLLTPWTPGAFSATYDITWGLVQDEIDDIPENNVNQNVTLAVTDYIYARDMNSPDGTHSNNGFGYEVGNLFDIYYDSWCKAVNVRLDANSELGSYVFAKIYSIDPNTGDFLFEMQSDYHTITAVDLASGSDLLLELLSCIFMTTTKTYLVVVCTDGQGGAAEDVVVSTSGTSTPQTSFFFDVTDATWYYTTHTPMVRLNFDNSTCWWGLDEHANIFDVNLYPNPATDAVSIDYDLGNASDVTIELTDLAGKTIATVNNTANAGVNTVSFNTEALSTGVYNVVISTDNGTVTEKFIKK